MQADALIISILCELMCMESFSKMTHILYSNFLIFFTAEHTYYIDILKSYSVLTSNTESKSLKNREHCFDIDIRGIYRECCWLEGDDELNKFTMRFQARLK